MSIRKMLHSTQEAVESFRLQCSLYLSYNRQSKYSLNAFTLYAGLESATSLYKHISTEGYFEWVKGKIADLDKRFSEMVSKLTEDYNKTKDRISELHDKVSQEDDEATLELSLSTTQASSVKYAVKTTLDGIKFASEHITSGGDEGDGERKKLKDEITDLWDEATKEGKSTQWKASKLKSLLETLETDLGEIYNEFKSFVKSSKTAESTTSKDSDSAEDSKKDIVSKLNTISGWFLTVFGSVDFAFIKLRKFLDIVEDHSKSYSIESDDKDNSKTK